MRHLRARLKLPAVFVGVFLLSACASQLSEAELRREAGIRDVSATSNAGAPAAPAIPKIGTPPDAAGSQPDAPKAAGPATATTPVAAGKPDKPVSTAARHVDAPGGAKPTEPAGPAGRSCSGSKSPIIIGTVGQQTGVLGAALVNGTKAVSAWASSVNAQGGLACHPVRYIVADDGGDPSRHLTLVRRLVEQDGVVAMVYQDALLTGQASAAYVNSKGIPVIGQEGGENQTYDSPIYFNHDISAAPLFDMTLMAGAKVAVPEGKTTLETLVCQEVAGCTTAENRWATIASELGFKSTYRGRASLLNVDFTSQCLSAKNAGVQALALSFDSTGIHRIAASCAGVGYHPLIICTSVQSNLDFRDDPNLKGAVIAQPLLPWFLTEFPAIAKYQSTLKGYAPGLPFDSSSLNGWGAAQLFAQATSAFAADTVTSKGIIESLAIIKENDLGGLTYPLSFSPGKPQVPQVCGWVVRADVGKFTSDGKRFCR